jgi:hypothetical protein
VTEVGWRGGKDATLLEFAQTRFDIFVTIDRNIEHQLNLRSFDLSFILIRVPDNTLSSYAPFFDELNKAADRIRQGEVIHFSCLR